MYNLYDNTTSFPLYSTIKQPLFEVVSLYSIVISKDIL